MYEHPTFSTNLAPDIVLIVLCIHKWFLLIMLHWDGQSFYFTINWVKLIFNWIIPIGTAFQKVEFCLKRSQRQLQLLLKKSLGVRRDWRRSFHTHLGYKKDNYSSSLATSKNVKSEPIIKFIMKFNIYKHFHRIFLSCKHSCKSAIFLFILCLDRCNIGRLNGFIKPLRWLLCEREKTNLQVSDSLEITMS